MNKPRLFALLGVLVLAFVVTVNILGRIGLPASAMQVEFVNSSDLMISSLQLDFGSAQGQSSILALRLAPGETRTLVLNHEPGAGFNVVARYADGVEQDFCANRGEQGQRQQVILQR